MKTLNRTQPMLFAVGSQKSDPTIPKGCIRARLMIVESVLLEPQDDQTKFAVADWNSPELRDVALCGGNVMGAPGFFGPLVEAMAEWAKENESTPTVAAEGIDEIQEHFDMLKMNDEDGDPAEAMLQNCAAIVVAAFRLAGVLLNDVPVERVKQLIEENRP